MAKTSNTAATDAKKISFADANIFVNRELSFLEFNQRVLQEVNDPSVPLLERLKFVSIVSANLDEFFMVRVAGLKQQVKSGVLETGPDGMLPNEQLDAIAQRVSVQVAEEERILLESLIPALDEVGIRILRVSELSLSARHALDARFERQMFPMLTPLAIDPAHPFPFLENRSLNLAVHLFPAHGVAASPPLLAVIQVPRLLPRFVDVDMPGELAVAFIEDVIAHHVDALFPGMRVSECIPFRVIRNWDLSFDEDEQEDLLETVEKELQRRWRLDAVRVEIGADASSLLIAALRDALELHADDVQLHRGPLALVDLSQIVERVTRADLRDPPFHPVTSPDLREADDIFAAIARRDVLLHHPYESYDPVVELLEQAAIDPQVLAIKQTLYRTTRTSPILRALVRAAESGKQVTALVELKARFDEELNVEWARILEAAGAHVAYGMIGLKTHCKVTMVVRREPTGIRRYVHLGTGNYNAETATTYSDLSLFSAREDVGADVSALFNLLTGYSEPPAWRRLVVAPLGLRRSILDLIDRERTVAKKGGRAKIVIKTNALIDPKTIRALCKAAQSGVEVVLLVRGPCALRVGIPGVSDRVTVRVIVDRFLEHSRILYFAHEGVEDVFITSTDIMPRNFDRRVEVMLPVDDERLRRRIVDEILAVELEDNVKASVLQPNGTYKRLKARGKKSLRAQAEFIARAEERAGTAGKTRRAGKGEAKRSKRGGKKHR